MTKFTEDTIEQAALLPRLISGELRVGEVNLNDDVDLS